jgi:predicted nucleotide-binding protein
MAMRQQSLQELVKEWRDQILEKRNRLVSIIERLDLIDEVPNLAQPQASASRRPQFPSSLNRKVFLVHGQDEEAKAVVARFITSCDLEPVILHEQANGGRTIIEKFEKESDVGFVVVLLTPDDVGGLRKGMELASDNLQARARQNVVLELGYFAGRLGRERVAALKKGDLELPSDIAGVVWTPMDPADAWKLSLARELRAAGYEFDIGKALSI